jgi:hypothetical protein
VLLSLSQAAEAVVAVAALAVPAVGLGVLPQADPLPAAALAAADRCRVPLRRPAASVLRQPAAGPGRSG